MTTTHGQRDRRQTRERRRRTPENRAVRRSLDALDWAAELPPGRQEEGRETLRRAHQEVVAALRHDAPGRVVSTLEMKVGPLPAAIPIATFLLGLGVGLTFGGPS